MQSLRANEALTHPGSLLAPDGRVIAPFDLEQRDAEIGEHVALASQPDILNAAAQPFELDYSNLNVAHVINGMGVTLGDSIVGLSALAAIRHVYPQMRFVVYRPELAPPYVEQLYALAAGKVAQTRSLPWPLASIPADETRIDLGNHLFWPGFMSLPMIDFFLGALGVRAERIASSHKANRWLQALELPHLPEAWRNQPYVLFCPAASTPIRSIPHRVHATLVERLSERFDLPVLGFGPVDHPRYIDVASASANTAHFLAWVKHARYVLTSDTAAVHIAAGFDIPSTAFFTTVAPELRVRDYPRCLPVTLNLPELRNVQASDRQQDMLRLNAAYDTALKAELPFSPRRATLASTALNQP
ncbi:glycosyltransferase family 9 protein [Paraburkholderia sp. BCC1885]|uniref:glycosyltransferase family 9 protein n=1 Tax=Paraburkholderia sp. BCC1885 TaxID=2562669 RepID=UPI001183EBFE|nr:glycosyltransferase family 9 protein [Paraburkholderia sp. BCC1885]